MRLRQAIKIVKKYVANDPRYIIRLTGGKQKQTFKAFIAEARFYRYIRKHHPKMTNGYQPIDKPKIF